MSDNSCDIEKCGYYDRTFSDNTNCAMYADISECSMYKYFHSRLILTHDLIDEIMDALEDIAEDDKVDIDDVRMVLTSRIEE